MRSLRLRPLNLREKTMDTVSAENSESQMTLTLSRDEVISLLKNRLAKDEPLSDEQKSMLADEKKRVEIKKQVDQTIQRLSDILHQSAGSSQFFDGDGVSEYYIDRMFCQEAVEHKDLIGGLNNASRLIKSTLETHLTKAAAEDVALREKRNIIKNLSQ